VSGARPRWRLVPAAGALVALVAVLPAPPAGLLARAGARSRSVSLEFTSSTVRGLATGKAVLRFTSRGAGRATSTLTTGRVVLARGVKQVTRSGRQRLTLRATADGQRALRRSSRLRGTARITLRDPDGNTARVARTVTVLP
jgi:hypothetical protein